MRKILTLLLVLLLGTTLHARPSISETATNGTSRQGYQWLNFEVQAEEIATSSSLVWYAHDIAGFSAIGIEDLEASHASANVTTINAMPLYSDGTEMTGEDVTITEGTDLTVFKSPSYKFTYESNTSNTTNVTFMFLIAD